MTKRHRQLLAHQADLDRRKSELAKEGHAIGDKAEAEKRLLTPEEKTRRDEILTELDTLKADLDVVRQEIDAETRLEEHERGAIVRDMIRPSGEARVLSGPIAD